MKGLKVLSSLLNSTPDISIWSWATVTDDSPLRVQLDGEDAALDITPDTLVGGLTIGTRVWVQLVTNANPTRRYRRLVIIGAAGPLVFTKRVLAETQNNTATLASDPYLFFTPPVAGQRWEIEIWGAYSTGVGQDFKCGFDLALGNNMRWTVDAPSLADTTKPNWDYVFDNSVKSLGRFGTYSPLRIKGVYNGVSADPLHFLWAQNTAGAGPTFLLNDTFMRATQIA